MNILEVQLSVLNDGNCVKPHYFMHNQLALIIVKLTAIHT